MKKKIIILVCGLFFFLLIHAGLRGQDCINIQCSSLSIDKEGAVIHVHFDKNLGAHDLEGLGRLNSLKSISCQGISFEESSEELSGLEKLTLTHGIFKGSFQKLRNLKLISLHNVQVDSQLLRELGQCRHLQSIEFVNGRLGKKMSREFESFLESNSGEGQKLNVIIFRKMPVSNAILASVSKSNVSGLGLYDCKIESDGLHLLKNFQHLEYSNSVSDDPQITNQLISDLVEQNPDLEMLGISPKPNASLESVEGLYKLIKLKKLQELKLNLNATVLASKRIAKELPELNVIEIQGVNLLQEDEEKRGARSQKRK